MAKKGPLGSSRRMGPEPAAFDRGIEDVDRRIKKVSSYRKVLVP
jgi:hypothetical protein